MVSSSDCGKVRDRSDNGEIDMPARMAPNTEGTRGIFQCCLSDI